jgi:murein tripeptide amidase MpaA
MSAAETGLALVLAAASQAVLPPELPWRGSSEALAVAASDPRATPVERSEFRRTPGYDETVAFLEDLTPRSPWLRVVSIGRSPEGRELWMAVASREGAATAAALRGNGRPTLLAQAGIHAGEIDGKDAGLMLLRDWSAMQSVDILERVNLLFVPIYNVDGHERASPYGRINQRGPEQTGWRTTARNLNLNRDYMKLDAPESRAMARVLSEWEPDLYLDLHVTDGADYQYDITYGWNGAHAWSPAIGGWLETVLRPRLDRDLRAQGHVPGPLVTLIDPNDPLQGVVDWTAPPRFSNGYGDARHLPTVLVENHSLKPYRQRVLGTRVLLESALAALAEPATAASLRAAISSDRALRRPTLAMGWGPSAEPPPLREFLAVGWRTVPAAIAGGTRIEWTGEKKTIPMPFPRFAAPLEPAARPAAYWIPPAWSEVIERLAAHGLAMERIATPRSLEVEMDRIVHFDLPKDPTQGLVFEGHVPITATTERIRRRQTFPAGSVRVSTDQPLGDLAMLLLEPASADSFFRWGFFLESLQPTEYAESYIMEPMAERMLREDPKLRAEFQARLREDRDFRDDPRARLDFFYRRTPFFDERAMVYPVGRELVPE